MDANTERCEMTAKMKRFFVHCVLATIDTLIFILLGEQNQKRAGSQGWEEKEATRRGRVQEAERRKWKNKYVKRFSTFYFIVLLD